jgi:isopenicillin N synthase-like dioxygenase
MSIPVLDLTLAGSLKQRPLLLDQLRNALFNVGFLYIINHGISESVISDLADKLPALFNLPDSSKAKLSKINSPHFLGYSGFAEETTQGKHDLREQFDFATELPVIYQENEVDAKSGRDFSKPYWWLRGPNQFPEENEIPGFEEAIQVYVFY